MYYYQFNIADYRSATVHLSNDEDLAYRRLIDMYYDTEAKISLDIDWVARRIRCPSEVVLIVLSDMFERHDDGYYHDRCQTVIEEYHSKAEKASKAGKVSAERQRNARLTNAQQSLNERTTDVQLTINQEPRTNNHKPITDSHVKTDKSVIDAKRVNCPIDEVVNLYHEECKSLPKVIMLNDTRRKHLVSRWRDVDSEDNLKNKDEGIEIFRGIFQKVQRSDFLCGRTQNRHGRSWKANFDWLMMPTNFLKVVEGQYDNERK